MNTYPKVKVLTFQKEMAHTCIGFPSIYMYKYIFYSETTMPIEFKMGIILKR